MPRCPSCHVLMTRMENEGIRMSSCPNCLGLWLGQVALQRSVRNQPPASANDTAASLQDLAEVVVASDTKEELHCPECPTTLVKDRLHPLIPVQIDRCPTCKSVWLDAGELELLKRLFRELQTTNDPRLAALRERLTGIQLQMARDRMETDRQYDRAEQLLTHTSHLRDFDLGTAALDALTSFLFDLPH